MLERITVLVIVYSSILLYDRSHLTTKAGKRGKAVYAILILVSLYMSVDYALNSNWPDYYDLVRPVLGEPSRKIDKLLTVPGK